MQHLFVLGKSVLLPIFYQLAFLMDKKITTTTQEIQSRSKWIENIRL